jgi:hypothetical protein
MDVSSRDAHDRTGREVLGEWIEGVLVRRQRKEGAQ